MADQETKKTFLDIVELCDEFPYGPAADEYYQLYLPHDSQPHGYMLPAIVEKMPWTSAFAVSHDLPRTVKLVDIPADGKTADAITHAFQDLINICIERDLFHVLCKRHSEMISIVSARYAGGSVHIERFAASLFGLTCRGAHLVAYTSSPRRGIEKIWIPRRSAHLYTYPSMLDTTVAGGVQAGVAPFQTIVEEADEEASLPEKLIRELAVSRGVISHMAVTGKGFTGEQGLVVPDYIYVYDMELPADIEPKPHDDEVNAFYCMSVDEVKASLLMEEFKPDSGAVLIDFFIRHGIITAENESNLVEINMRLHRWLPFRTG
ncbi:hypothetical protein DOTSEDRAFT_52333 [Dothistroma septosporum NZE10]|uniref:Nudix hydrolase domain-containing protein n=1 Tax=Dothistroma septosporum (strain NZE10 / CBS 128990) TaxID=675120 RepID=N1PR68_DOTSN|nr:hypothetical protein DOTSEDRAFT_52333 [Dothistroma septosporum NZE10]